MPCSTHIHFGVLATATIKRSRFKIWANPCACIAVVAGCSATALCAYYAIIIQHKTIVVDSHFVITGASRYTVTAKHKPCISGIGVVAVYSLVATHTGIYAV